MIRHIGSTWNVVDFAMMTFQVSRCYSRVSYITSTKIAFFLSGSVSELSARVASNLTTRVGVCPHPLVRSNARYRSQRRGCGAANEAELPALQASK